MRTFIGNNIYKYLAILASGIGGIMLYRFFHLVQGASFLRGGVISDDLNLDPYRCRSIENPIAETHPISTQYAQVGIPFYYAFDTYSVFAADAGEIIEVSVAFETENANWLLQGFDQPMMCGGNNMLPPGYNFQAVRGNDIYLTSNSNIQIISINNPSHPSLRKSLQFQRGQFRAVDEREDYAYLADNHSFDIVALNNATDLSSHPLTGDSYNIGIDNDYAYVLSKFNLVHNITIYNVKSSELKYVNSFNITIPEDYNTSLKISNNHCYYSYNKRGIKLQIISILDHAKFKILEPYLSAYFDFDAVNVVGDYAYAGIRDEDTREAGILIINISDSLVPTLVEKYYFGDNILGYPCAGFNNCYVWGVATKGDSAYVTACGYDDADSTEKCELKIINVSNKTLVLLTLP